MLAKNPINCNSKRILFLHFLGLADESSSIPLPKVVDAMTNIAKTDKTNIDGVVFDKKLLEIMKASIQYPHIAEENQTNRNMPSGAAFPFCHYNNEDASNSGNSQAKYF